MGYHPKDLNRMYNKRTSRWLFGNNLKYSSSYHNFCWTANFFWIFCNVSFYALERLLACSSLWHKARVFKHPHFLKYIIMGSYKIIGCPFSVGVVFQRPKMGVHSKKNIYFSKGYLAFCFVHIRSYVCVCLCLCKKF